MEKEKKKKNTHNLKSKVHCSALEYEFGDATCMIVQKSSLTFVVVLFVCFKL